MSICRPNVYRQRLYRFCTLVTVRRAPFVIAAVLFCACRGAAPPSPPTGSAPPADRYLASVHSCARISSCAHKNDPPHYRDASQCVERWLAWSEENNSAVRCFGSARSCSDVDACLHRRSDTLVTAVCNRHSGESTFCEGETLYQCDDENDDESRAVRCADIKGECKEHKTHDGLSSRACISPAMCPAGAPESRCLDATTLLTCDNGAADIARCDPGETCRLVRDENNEPTAYCAKPEQTQCDRVGKRYCEGSKLVRCAPAGAKGAAEVLDCAKYGLACDPTSAQAACRVAIAPQATCRDGNARCRDHDQLEFCALGLRVAISCKSLGFTSCDPDGNGLEAACTVGPSR
jgi:hypothetical protein